MILRWLTPMRPAIFVGLLVYFLASCLVARVINGDSEHITDPRAALVLALMATVLAVFSIAPVVSLKARATLLRADAIFGRGDKWSLLLSGAITAAFAGGFLVVAARGL